MKNFVLRVADFLGRRFVWLVAFAIFWTVWFNIPSVVIGLYDINLWGLKMINKAIAIVVPYGSAVDGCAQLLDNWVSLIKSATRFFRGYGGERTELLFRTLAFEGVLLWWEVKLLTRYVIGKVMPSP